MRLAANVDYDFISTVDAATKPWCIKMQGKEKVDIYELLLESEVNFNQPWPPVDASKINWWNRLGYLVYFTSLWQRLSVRNNGKDISQWLMRIAEINTVAITKCIQDKDNREYVIRESNGGLLMMATSNSKKYNRDQLIAIINLYGREIWRSQMAIAALLASAPTQVEAHHKAITEAVIDQLLSIIK